MAKIRDLPEEVLLIIFSYLKLRDRKVASRVSRLWNHLIFSDRPMRTIALHVTDYLKPKERKCLMSSKRLYRNLILEWVEASCVPFLDEVLRKFGGDITTLKLSTYVVTPPVLVKFLLRTPKLDELIIEGCFVSDDCDLPIPPYKHIRALQLSQRGFEHEVGELIPRVFPNLESLDVMASEAAAMSLISFYARQLKCLHLHMESEQYRKFCNLDGLENLKRLNIYWPQSCDQRLVVESYRQMRNLESACLSGPINEDSFKIICNQWNQLQYLSLNVHSLKVPAFRQITQLKHIKVLKLQGSVRETNFLQGISLPSVLSLILDGVTSENGFYSNLVAFVPNIQLLHIYDHTIDNANVMLITKTMTSLRALSLEYCYQLKDEAFRFLNHLKDLVELRCWSVPISENALVKFPKCPNLRNLSIGGSGWITDKTILDIPQVFPALRELTIADCFKVHEDTIYTLQERMRGCAVYRQERPDPDRDTEQAWAKRW
ncbi:uncharacterized protein LOC129744488 isoform X2 [Uranotaenia lowii]|uniref:uncharacterized protein LOC129744488 isoform X2 n=1 Tax=Uranotaenia lowii TaxID=190385 RepID=UPI00247A20EE|nr:uncharacterized protein LOC129744488 isoform X2 [Uranotaenia lowii]